MDDADDENSFRFNSVNEPVTSDEELAEVGQLRVRQAPTAFRELCERITDIADLLGKSRGICRGVSSHELDGGFEIVDGGIRPDYFTSHLESRFFTWACVFTLPLVAASRLL